ncbi:MAG TPA: ABC transporter substrate-binding protein, partial [Candidatus Limnocylindria bacterium]|nr:ABC transporter substrate-binding protein [Candidatus Limnocylindria bacterium]
MADKPVRGGRVITAGIADIRTMQPILVSETASGSITRLIYDGLIQANPKSGQPEPNMAKFTQSSDGKTYTFEIDPRAVWSDGKPVVAEDWYVATKLVGMSKVTPRKSSFQDIVGWKDFVDGKATEI